ncbi:MAG: aromatic amino acid lyase, partial [Thermoanaerobaculia bacterium]
HVSMSTHAARKMRTILGNVQSVLAIELIVAAQAVEWRVSMMNGVPEAHTIADAETQAKAFESAVSGRASQIAQLLGRGSAELYLRIRRLVDPLFADRPLHEAIRRVKLAITS